MGNVDRVDRTLPLNEMIYHVRTDSALRHRWREDFAGLAREFGLSAEEVDAVTRSDVRRLNELDVHQLIENRVIKGQSARKSSRLETAARRLR